ncbi:S8 family serine peptidase [Candidatus Saccharibacteria bacterium]|nr:S8 family serine peptidase [Candidatus Saccharibacteria bacterium]
MIEIYSNDPDVELVEPNYERRLLEVIPNDPNWSSNRFSAEYLGLPRAWDYTIGDSNIVVAIIDTGFYYNHLDINQSNIVKPYNAVTGTTDVTDTHGHGTQVMGTVGAVGNNGRGTVGVAWGVGIMPIKCADANNSISTAAVARGITYAVDNGAKIISMSLGGSSDSVTERNAVDYAYSKGAILVAAAGNEGGQGSGGCNGSAAGICYPGRYANVIGVGSAQYSRTVSHSFGQGINIMGTGGWYTTTRSGGYGSAGGTSFSTPQVAAVAGLLWSYDPTLTNKQVQDYLEEGAVDLYWPGWDVQSGYGVLNAYRSLQLLAIDKGHENPPFDSSRPNIAYVPEIIAPLGQTTTYQLNITGATPPYSITTDLHSYPDSKTVTSSEIVRAIDKDTGILSITPSTSGEFWVGVMMGVYTSDWNVRHIKVIVPSTTSDLNITTPSLPSGVKGTSYSATMAATGGTAPYTWSIKVGSTLTKDLSINSSTGVISGTPASSGAAGVSEIVHVTVIDSTGKIASKPYRVYIVSTSETTPSIATSSLQSGIVGDAYSQTLNVTGGTGPYTWSATGLPTGLTISSAGVISGTPTTAGAYSVRATVTDNKGGNVTKSIGLAVTKIETSTPTPTKTTPTTSNIDYSIPTGIIYNASPRPVTTPAAKPGVIGLGTITVRYAGTGGTTYAESTTAPTNAGSYTVYADIAEGINYSAVKLNLGTYNIDKKSISLSSGTIAPKTYDTTTTATVTAVTFTGLEGGQSLTLTTDYTVSSAQFNNADAGTGKTVTGTVALVANSKTNNYILSSGALSVGGQVIGQASADGVNQEFNVKAGIANVYSFDLDTLLPFNVNASDVSAYNIESIDGDIYTSPPSIHDLYLSLPIALTASGSAKSLITISFVSTNYNIAEAVISINVTERTPVEISGISITSRAYNGNPITISGTPIFTETILGTTIDTLSPTYTWKTSADITLGEAPTNAGNYKLVVSADDSGDYDVADLEISFSILKADQTISFSCPVSGYVGDTITLSASNSTGLPGIVFTSWNTNIATVSSNTLSLIGVGTVTITASHPGDLNRNNASQSCNIAVALPNYRVIQHFADFNGIGHRIAIINADFNEFIKLTLDGADVHTDHYDVSEGSTVITLHETYLGTLNPGTYTFLADFGNGNVVPLGIVILAGTSIGLPGTGIFGLILNGGYLSIGLAISSATIISFVIFKQRRQSRRIRL